MIRAPLRSGTYTIEYSFIGRKSVTRSVNLAEDRTVTVDPVYLEETAIALEELVVTSTGMSAERRTVGNAIETVQGEAVNNAPGATSVDQALQGKVTGAWISEHSGQPGGGVSIRLRGASSILGGAEPLIVVDGVIVDNSSSALISLGANATRGNAALTNRLADLAPQDIERIEVLKGAAAAAIYGSRANNGVIQIFTKRGRQGPPRVTYRSELTVSSASDQYDLNMSPFAGLADVIWGPADSIGQPVPRFDIQDSLFRSQAGVTQYLSVAGGSEETSYFISGSYTDEGGVIRPTDHSKGTVRANLTQRFGTLLEVAANGNFVQADYRYVPEGEQVQGTLTNILFGFPTSFSTFFDPELGRYPLTPILGPNPLDVIHNWDATSEVTRFQGSVETVARPIERLSIRYLFGIDDYREENTFFQPPFSVSASFAGEIQNPIRLSRNLNHDIVGEYRATLSPAVALLSTAGFRYANDRVEVIRASARDLPPGQTLVGGATQFASQGVAEFRTVTYFLQERVSLHDRLYLTGGLNLEASSAFGVDERWQWFPRISGSYVLHEEPFWRDGGIRNLISSLRLRAAYGETGGQPPGVYDRFENYIPVAYAGRPGLVASTSAGNPDLKPEREREIEFGFDLGLWNDRAVAEFSYYDDRTTDLVLPIPLAPSRGVQAQLQNIGELTNKGFELAVTTVNVRKPGFRWTTRLQLGHNSNRVDKLVTKTDTLIFPYFNAVIEGQPVGVFYGWYYRRDAQGNIVIDPNTGLGDRADTVINGQTVALKRILGDPTPDLIASLNNTFGIGRNLQVSFLLDGRFGNEVANFSRRIAEFFGSDRVVEEEIERAIARKSDPSLPPLQYTLNTDRLLTYEEYVEDGSFVKLREVAVQYDFDPSFARRLGASTLTLRVAARNLITWTDYSGLDPEINLFSAHTVSRGVDFATTPIPRTFSAGLTLTF